MADFSTVVATQVTQAVTLNTVQQVVAVNSSVPGSYGQVPLLSFGWYSVKDPTYGAVGDGTTDDTVAVAAALAAVPTGGVLFFPKGNYSLATWTVQAITKQITILGFDRESTILTGPAAKPAFLTTSKAFRMTGVKLTSFGKVVDCDPIATTVAGVGVTECWFHDTGIPLAWQTPDASGLANEVRFDDNRCTSLTSFGVLGSGAVNTFHATRNVLDGGVGRAIQWGANTHSLQDTWKNHVVTANTIRNFVGSGTSEGGGILLYGIRGTLTGNTIDGITNSGTLETWGVYTKLRFGAITGNTISGLSTTGSGLISNINIKGSLRGVTSSPNGYGITCAGNTINCGGVGSGIRSEGDDHQVENNYIDDPGVDGISVDSSSGNRNGIKGNHIYGTAGASTVGIRLSTGVSGEVATDNHIYNFPIGIRVSTATLTTTDVEVSRNQFLNCTQNIVVTLATGTGLVTRFTAKGNRGNSATDGISFEGTGAVTVADVLDNIFTNTTNPVKWSTVSNMPLHLNMRGNGKWVITPTTATTTTILSLPLADEGAYMVRTRTMAQRSDGGARAYYERGALIYRDAAGSATSQGTTTDVTIESDASWDQLIDTSSNNFRVRFVSSADTITVSAEIDVWGVN